MRHGLSDLVLGKERTTAICTGATLGLAALRLTLTQRSTSELIGPRYFLSIVRRNEQFPSIILDGEMLVWDPVSGRNLPFGTLKTAALGMFY
jgi:hypothetical protein